MRRAKCRGCGHLVPADSDLVVKLMLTTGDNRPLIGDLHRRPNGRKGATPMYFCTGCAVRAVMQSVCELVGEHTARADTTCGGPSP